MANVITMTALMINHPGRYSTLYAEQIRTVHGLTTLLWVEFTRQTPFLSLMADQPQPVFGQQSFMIDGRPHRLRWLVPNVPEDAPD
jgi:hypothetical protein